MSPALKGVKRLADVDIYVNGEWVKTQHIGRVTTRQMIAAATKIAKSTAKETNAEHVHIFAAFGSLHLAEIVATANGVTLEIPACALRCLLKDIEETNNATTPDNTTPETTDTMNTNTTTPETMNEANTIEFSELSHAGQCLDIYLHNTAEIYKRYTVEAVRYAAGLAAFGWDYVTETLMNGAKVNGVKVVDEAINAAVKLVRKYDHLTPTAKDIEQVTRNYAAYIVECAKYEIENA